MAEKIAERTIDETLKTRRREFGEFLKLRRSEKGLSLEGISQETRISCNFLKALEGGDFEQLPGQVFGRGFVKNISKLLNDDPVEMVSLYDACWIESTASLDKKKTFNFGNQGTSKIFDKISKLLMWQLEKAPQNQIVLVSGVIVVAMSVFFGYPYLTQYLKEKSLTSTVETSNIDEHKSGALQHSLESQVLDKDLGKQAVERALDGQAGAQAEVGQASTVDSPAIETHTLEALGSKSVVEIHAKGPVTIKTKIDGKKQEILRLNGETTQIHFQGFAELSISDGSAVEIFFNNKSLGNLGAKGRARRLVFQTQAPTGFSN